MLLSQIHRAIVVLQVLAKVRAFIYLSRNVSNLMRVPTEAYRDLGQNKIKLNAMKKYSEKLQCGLEVSVRALMMSMRI
jgi:hypothetical protein